MGKPAKPAENTAQLQRLYRMVLTIRRAEGLIPGFIHLSIGQEVIAAGVMDALTPVWADAEGAVYTRVPAS
jgi:TPP-dependent pyruvate/acetoin dehydrogenase alpha subunit